MEGADGVSVARGLSSEARFFLPMCLTRSKTPLMLPFSVQFRPGVPAYEQIVLAAKRAIAGGRLGVGEAFPSVRAMSRELKLTPNTCQKAVSALVNEGLLEVRPGVGTIVCTPPRLAPKIAAGELRESIDQLVVEARQRGLSLENLKRAVAESWRNLKSES